jgi:hypothetical protein
MAEATEAIKDNMAQTVREANDLAGKVRGSRFEFRTLLDTAEKAEESIKALATHTKNVTKAAMGAKSGLAGMQQAYQEIIASSEELLATGKLTHRQQAALTQEVARLKEEQAELAKETKYTADEQEKYGRSIQRSAIGMGKLVDVAKKLELKGFSRELDGISKTLSAMGVNPKFLKEIQDLQKRSADVKTAIEDTQRQRGAEFKGQKSAAITKLGLRGKEVTSDSIEAVAKEMGLTGKKAQIFKQGEMAKAGLLPEGADVEGATKAYEALAGGETTGVMGAVESGLSGVADAAMEAAPYIIALKKAAEYAVKAWDALAQQRQKMEESLGNAGLFGYAPGAEGFANARAALTPGGLGYTQLGLSFERNMKMAQAVGESGYALPEVGGENAQKLAGNQFAPGSFGMIQRTAATTGRLLGMSDVQSVEQIMKLLTKYQVALDQTDDFFLGVQKGAKAAGLSYTKYISLLDGVLEHFTRMNKSIEQVTNVLMVLGKTGVDTADDLQEYLDTLTGASTKRDIAPEAYIIDKAQPEFKKASGTFQKQLAANAAEVLGQMSIPTEKGGLPPLNIDVASVRGAFESGDAGKMTEAIQSMTMAASELPDEQKKLWTGHLEKLTQMMTQLQGLRAGAGGGVGGAFYQELYGKSPVASTIVARTALQQAASTSGMDMKQFLQGKALSDNALGTLSGVAKVFGETPEAYAQKQRDALMGGARGFLKSAQEGALPEDQAKLIVEGLHKQGVPIQVKGISNYGVYLKKFLKDNEKNLGNSVLSLAASDQMNDLLVNQMAADTKATQAQKNAARDQAAKVARLTQTSADMVANAFSTWMNRLVDYTGGIFKKIGEAKPASEMLKDLAAKDKGKGLENLSVALEDQKAALQGQIDQLEKIGDLSEDQKKQLSAAHQELSDVNDGLGELSSSTLTSDMKDQLNKLYSKYVDTEDKKANDRKQAIAEVTKGGNMVSSMDVYKAVSAMPGAMGSGINTLTFKNQDLAGNQDLVDALNKLQGTGQITAKPVTGMYGQKMYQITINQYSADISHISPIDPSSFRSTDDSATTGGAGPTPPQPGSGNPPGLSGVKR